MKYLSTKKKQATNVFVFFVCFVLFFNTLTFLTYIFLDFLDAAALLRVDAAVCFVPNADDIACFWVVNGVVLIL